MSEPLHHRMRHSHVPVNVNVIHDQETTGWNARLAVWLTQTVGSMPTAYLFTVLAGIGLLALLGVFNPLTALLVAWTSQTFIQLVLLPVIMVGQNVLGRHAELQTEEAYHTTQHSFHDIEQMMEHLDKQDEELLRQTALLLKLLEKK